MIAALLLAAGLSKRFGAPKLLVELEGRPLVRWSAEALVERSGGEPIGEVVVVTGREDAAIRRALHGLAVRFAVNATPEQGMGGSIACGIAAMGADVRAVVIALADEPRPSRSALEQVVRRYLAGEGGRGTAIVVPTFRGVPGHPVLFDRSVFEELLRLRGDRGAREVVQRDATRVAVLPLTDEAPNDVDVPGDLGRFA
ncbi:MAG: nucleotidyltransferase family protein [Gemmatimonadaceae bacterium]